MANCLVEHHDRNIDRVLATVPGEAGSTLALLHAAIGPCLVAERPISGRDFFVRGAIAERLLSRDFPAVGAGPRHRAVPVFAPVSRDYLGRAEEQSRRLLAMLDLASCITRRESAKVYAFFGAERGSPAERAAMAEFTPAISACLFEGQTFEMPPPVFRGFLAEAAYRAAAGQPDVYETSQ
jgi:hypothetical protein